MEVAVTELLFVGKSTAETLKKFGIRTIGELALSDEEAVCKILGKRGRQLRIFARGEDDEPVHADKKKEDVKSIGNSVTLPKDVTSRDDVKRWLYAISESVTARQRFAGVGKANTVHVVVRNDRLQDTTFQTKIKPTLLCGDVAKTAFQLFCQHIPTGTKVRMLGVSVSGFDYNVEQLSFDSVLDGGGHEKKERAEDAVAKIREKYGYASLQRGLVMEDERLNGLDIRGKKETEDA